MDYLDSYEPGLILTTIVIPLILIGLFSLYSYYASVIIFVAIFLNTIVLILLSKNMIHPKAFWVGPIIALIGMIYGLVELTSKLQRIYSWFNQRR